MLHLKDAEQEAKFIHYIRLNLNAIILNKKIVKRKKLAAIYVWNLHRTMVPATHLPDLALIAGRPCQSTLPSSTPKPFERNFKFTVPDS